MFRSGSSGAALLLTTLFLAGFAFFSFMGLSYLYAGDLRWSLLVCLGGVLLLSFFLWLACRTKTERQRRLPLEVISLLGAAAILFLGRAPFSQFIYVLENKSTIDSLATAARNSAAGLDIAYLDYVDNRVKNYRKNLKNDSNANVKVNSLKRRLKPEDLNNISETRKAWIDQLENLNIWNPGTAKNLYHLIGASEKWVAQYANVSRIIYKDEGSATKPFSMPIDDIKGRYAEFTTRHVPDIWSNIAMIVCCLSIMAFYIQSNRSRNKYKGRRA